MPEASPLNHRILGRHGDERGAAFYLDALSYGHTLWQQGHAGRAILALTRALYAEVEASDPILKAWPLPYNALFWVIQKHPSNDFPGNPRISFQHQATRLVGARRELRSARAWAVWALTCAAKPSLPADKTQGIIEPTPEEISARLRQHGHPNEASLWLDCLSAALRGSP